MHETVAVDKKQGIGKETQKRSGRKRKDRLVKKTSAGSLVRNWAVDWKKTKERECGGAQKRGGVGNGGRGSYDGRKD